MFSQGYLHDFDKGYWGVELTPKLSSWKFSWSWFNDTIISLLILGCFHFQSFFLSITMRRPLAPEPPSPPGCLCYCSSWSSLYFGLFKLSLQLLCHHHCQFPGGKPPNTKQLPLYEAVSSPFLKPSLIADPVSIPSWALRPSKQVQLESSSCWRLEKRKVIFLLKNLDDDRHIIGEEKVRWIDIFKNLDNGQQNGHGVIGIMINTVVIIVMIMCVINI